MAVSQSPAYFVSFIPFYSAYSKKLWVILSVLSVNEFDNLYFDSVSLEILYLSTFVLSKSVLTYLSTYLNM